MAKEKTPSKHLKEHLTLVTYDSPTTTRMLAITGPLEVKHSLIQMLPFFHVLESKNSFKHVNAFLETCSTVFLNNVSNEAF